MAAVGQFPSYALIVGAAELTGPRGRRRALIAIGLTHLLAALAAWAMFYAAGG